MTKHPRVAAGLTSSPARHGAVAALVLLLAVARCGRGSDGSESPQGEPAAAAPVAQDVSSERAEPRSPDAAAESERAVVVSFVFTEVDLDAYELGLAHETELVRAAQERALSATTPEERGAATQAQWEDATAPEGARVAGVPVERYRATREAVNHVLETLDFQGKIDGPMELDTIRATPEMRERLRRDPFGELPPQSAAALKARLGELVPLWSQYVELTAVAG